MRIAVDLRKELASTDSDKYNCFLVLSEYDLGWILSDSGCPEESARFLEDAHILRKRLPSETLRSVNSELAFSLHEFAFTHHKSGRSEKALRWCLEVQNIWKEPERETPDNDINHYELATIKYTIGICYAKLGQFGEAIVAMQETLDIFAKTQIKECDTDGHKPSTTNTHRQLSRYLVECGRYVEAAEHSKIADEHAYELKKMRTASYTMNSERRLYFW